MEGALDGWDDRPQNNQKGKGGKETSHLATPDFLTH